MLSRLTVNNVVLIDFLEIEFNSGLVVFSGETGAGKSILLEALGLAIGRRAEVRLIGNNKDYANVIAEFKIKKTHPVNIILLEKAIDVRENLILRRELRKDGASRAFINDSPVTVGLLSSIGSYLVEIHGQNEKIGLIDPATHLQILDQYIGNSIFYEDVKNTYNAFIKLQKIFNQATELGLEKKNKEEEINSSLAFLNGLDLKEGEEEKLSSKRNMMMQSEKIAKNINLLNKILIDEDRSNVFIQMADIQKNIEKIIDSSGESENLKNLSLALERTLIEAKETESYLDKVLSEINYDPKDLEYIEDRLFSIRTAARRFKVSPNELIKLKSKLEEEIKVYNDTSLNLVKLQEKLELSKNIYIEKATILSEKRTKYAENLSLSISKELEPLKLADAKFRVDLTKKEFKDWNEIGSDKARFLVTMNAGSAEGELHKVSSGGELARLMLAINLVLAKSMNDISLVFDEVDSGVSGSVANAVGNRLKQVSYHQQVIVVTHLPQVAASGKQHLKLNKYEKNNMVVTEVFQLDEVSRIEEVARMLSGEDITEEARAAANSLLRNSFDR